MSRPLRPRLPLSQLFTEACAKSCLSLPFSAFGGYVIRRASRCQHLEIARDRYSVI